MEINKSISIEVTNQDIDDIVESAIYGIGYWSFLARDDYSTDSYIGEYVANEGTCTLYDADEVNRYVYEEAEETGDFSILDKYAFPKKLSKQSILDGISLLFDSGDSYTNGVDTGDQLFMVNGSGKRILDTSMVDSIWGDIIVQLGIFGEVVYG